MVKMGTAPNLRSISPASYAQLPSLAYPAAYILVIRDIDSDRYRIQATDHPKSYINVILAEQERNFGIELLSILETDDIAVSELRLFERHHAALSDEWLDLDAYQLKELRCSELRIHDHNSNYLSSRPAASIEALRSSSGIAPKWEGPASAQSHRTRRSAHHKPGTRTPLSANRYGANALRRNGGRRSSSLANTVVGRKSIRQSIDIAVTDLWTNHPWKCLLALGLVVFVCLASYDYSCPNPRSGCPDRGSNATGPSARSNSADESSVRMLSLIYVVRRSAAIRACPSLVCKRESQLSPRTQIRPLGTVSGDDINGSDRWIKFRHDGRTMYIHSSDVSQKP